MPTSPVHPTASAPRGAKRIHELKNTATKAQSFDVTYFVEN